MSDYPIRNTVGKLTRLDWPGVFAYVGEGSDFRVYLGSRPMTTAAARELAATLLAAAEEVEQDRLVREKL